MKQHRILIIHDVEIPTPKGILRWAFATRSAALQEYAPPDFSVDRCCSPNLPAETLSRYDLIFNLEAASPQRDRIKRLAPNAILVVSFNNDPKHLRANRWKMVYDQADYVLVNNFAFWDHIGRLPRTCNISNGVDTKMFKPRGDISTREHRVFWTGGRNPKKGKNLQSVIEPAVSRAEEHGFIMDIRPVDEIVPEQVLAPHEMVSAYNRSSYVLCCSSTDATPGTSLEGLACGCVLVTTRVGAALELGLDRQNVVFIDPTPESLIDGLLYARENRERLSLAGLSTIAHWGYGPPGNRALWYFALFRALLEGRTPDPFTYMDTGWEMI